MDKSGQDHESFKELCTGTDLALRATKETAQAISKTMASLVMLEHLWLNLTEIMDTEKMAFLNSLVSLKGLFGPTVDRFAECFTETQKTLQVLHHFLPKHSTAAASSHQKTPSTQQPAKSVPPRQKSEPGLEQCFQPAK